MTEPRIAEREIRDYINDYIKRIVPRLPDNTRVITNGLPYIHVEFRCNKKGRHCGSCCAYDPGHEGQCWSEDRRVHFDGVAE